MSVQLSTNLADPDAVPYFLWDDPMTVRELRERLATASEPERDRLLGKILREARDPDVWHFTTPREVALNWPRLSLHLGRRRPFWEFILGAWRESGLLEHVAVPPAVDDAHTNSSVFPSFTSFVEVIALPIFAVHPDWIRLDGEVTGGNRKVAGRFDFKGATWRVHFDTHFEPLLLAYYAAKFHPDTPALVEAPTPGDSSKLLLADSWARLRAGRHQHFFVYADGTS